ncbi:MAG: Stage 0 sporulation protein J [Parcubacteria group bacterium GW2011_GWC2_39_14]|nr:MAG: Stage 0 sporulation protein J [Parcubacteria group bacterium GW2011_GWC2_39_14]
MNQNTGGLGRGLNSLIPQKNNPPTGRVFDERKGNLLEVSVNEIRPNTRQPRLDFGEQAQEELVGSVREHGILQPLVVIRHEDHYELIAGERRLRAAKEVGLKTVPVIVRTADEQTKLELSLIENLQRQDLNAIEEAKSFKALHEEFGMSHDDIAKRVGRSRPVISNTIRLLDLPGDIQDALIVKRINYTQSRALLALSQIEQRRTFEELMRGEKIISSDIEKRAPPTRRQEDPNLKAAEARLREVLGTKVLVKRRAGRGSIVVEFYSDEELQDLIYKIVGE